LAILYAIPESALYDPNRSQELLQTLIKDYPTSRHIPEAKLLIRLNEEITKLEHEAQEKSRRAKELSDELERLKEIDLRGTRSRPPDY
jgi:outer membrane protein assembly factor BamD (BamD/ComL family)